MEFILVEAVPFIKDLRSLESPLSETVLSKLKLLEKNPRHSSLRTESVASVSGIFRSWVNGFYRIYWLYHPREKGKIVLWRVGPRTWTDRLKNLPLPALEDVRPLPSEVDQDSTEPSQMARDAQSGTVCKDGFFSDVHRNHLILLGVPDNQVQRVKNLDDIEMIYELGLPDYAEQVLVELYTAGYWGIDKLVCSDQIFFRANADELENYCKGRTTKLLLDLHPEQRAYAYLKANGPLLVKGVAGSGKTTIGLYRALHWHNS